ncbi:MAG TPA: DUF2269 family protein [Acidimicrobiales bacterium]|nr:DUF2269 family protein [Acidimicrobiales bacterium]
MGVDTTAWKVLLLLHILAAIFGFGGVVLNGVYGARAKARGPNGGLAIAEANFHVTEKWAAKFIYAVPVLGVGLVVMSDGVFELSQMWVWLSLILFFTAMGISHGVMFPTAKKMQSLMRDMESGPPPQGGPPPQVAELEALGRQMGILGMTLNLHLVAILALMIWKPGL